MIVVETERLILREAKTSDAAFVLTLLNSPSFIENIGDRGVRTEAEAAAYIEERMVASYRDNGFGMWLALEKAGGRPVGMAGLVRRDGLDVPDVGYAFLPEAWGRGYAQEAARAAMAHGRKALGMDALAAITTPENEASMAVLRKVGFVFQRMIRLPGAETDSTYFMNEGEQA